MQRAEGRKAPKREVGAVAQTHERLHPDWMEPFAYDPERHEHVSVWELMRATGTEGSPGGWWTEHAGLDGPAYAVSLSHGMDRPRTIMRILHRNGAWAALDTEIVSWAYNWCVMREAKGNRLIPHVKGDAPKTMRVFPSGVVWHIDGETEGGDRVSLPGTTRQYTVDRRHLHFCDRRPCGLDQALQERWLFGPSGSEGHYDGHPLHPVSAELLLKYGRRRRTLVARHDGGRLLTMEHVRAWEQELGGVEPVADALAACYAVWGDADNRAHDAEEEEDPLRRFMEGKSPRSMAELEAFTELFWAEMRQVRVVARAIEMVRQADKDGRKKGQLVALPSRGHGAGAPGH